MNQPFSAIKLPLEKTELDIGFVALTDSAPLVVAQHLGIFERWGLEVNLKIQPSWATIRDRLQGQVLDAAQLLAPMPLAAQLGLNGNQNELINALNLSFNGNAVTLSLELYDQVKAINGGEDPSLPLDATWIKQIVDYRKDCHEPKLKLACVYPFSCHYYQLRDWLIKAGIRADEDVEFLFIPPTEMTKALANNQINGFCAGNPWNTKAARENIGVTVLTSNDVWSQTPEKILSVTRQWHAQHPNSYLAMVAALQQACNWLKSTSNRFEAAVMLKEYIDEPIEVLAPSLIGDCLTGIGHYNRHLPDLLSFNQEPFNIPDVEQGQFLLGKFMASGQYAGSPENAKQAIKEVYRTDIYQDVIGILNQLGEE